jgi:hypothetical protein
MSGKYSRSAALAVLAVGSKRRIGPPLQGRRSSMAKFETAKPIDAAAVIA